MASSAPPPEQTVQVFVRKRPTSKKENASAGSHDIVRCKGKKVTVMGKGKAPDKTYGFDGVLGPHSTQEDVFDCVAKPLVESTLEGYNSTMFAYGQTGTGKTWTMEGDLGAKQDMGIIPRSVQHMFTKLEKSKVDFSMKLSVLQVYNEGLYDLLDPGTKKSLTLCETRDGVSCQNLEEVTINDTAHAMQLFRDAVSHRFTAETEMNRDSSRSHLIVQMLLHMKEETPDGEDVLRQGRLNLIDLAGSECIGRSKATGKTAKEAGNINKSLQSLKRVISHLVERRSHVPYRDSKLTRLLRDSLGGTAKTCLIATVSPDHTNREETTSTLEYMHTAKNIKNKPQVNSRTTKRAYIRGMEADHERMKDQLQAQREKSGVYLPVAQHEQMVAKIEGQTAQLEELESAMEVTRAKVASMQGERDEATAALQERTGQLAARTAELDGEKEQHTTTRADLMQTREELEDCGAVLGETQATEAALQAQGERERAALAAARADVDGLHAKVGRHADADVATAAGAEDLKAGAQAQCAALRERAARFGAEHGAACAALRERVDAAERAQHEAASALAAVFGALAGGCAEQQAADAAATQALAEVTQQRTAEAVSLAAAQCEHARADTATRGERVAAALTEAKAWCAAQLQAQSETLRAQKAELQGIVASAAAFVKEQSEAIAAVQRETAGQAQGAGAALAAQREAVAALQAEQAALIDAEKAKMEAAVAELLGGFGARVTEHTSAAAKTAVEHARVAQDSVTAMAQAVAGAADSAAAQGATHTKAVGTAGTAAIERADAALAGAADAARTHTTQLDTTCAALAGLDEEAAARSVLDRDATQAACERLGSGVSEHAAAGEERRQRAETQRAEHAAEHAQAVDAASAESTAAAKALAQALQEQEAAMASFEQAQGSARGTLEAALGAYAPALCAPTGGTPQPSAGTGGWLPLSGLKRTRAADDIIASSRKKRSGSGSAAGARRSIDMQAEADAKAIADANQQAETAGSGAEADVQADADAGAGAAAGADADADGAGSSGAQDMPDAAMAEAGAGAGENDAAEVDGKEAEEAEAPVETPAAEKRAPKKQSSRLPRSNGVRSSSTRGKSMRLNRRASSTRGKVTRSSSAQPLAQSSPNVA
eukprot:g749.t1